MSSLRHDAKIESVTGPEKVGVDVVDERVVVKIVSPNIISYFL